jgi:hypothetical protein
MSFSISYHVVIYRLLKNKLEDNFEKKCKWFNTPDHSGWGRQNPYHSNEICGWGKQNSHSQPFLGFLSHACPVDQQMKIHTKQVNFICKKK